MLPSARLMPFVACLLVAFITAGAGAQQTWGPASRTGARSVAGGTSAGVGVRALSMGGAYTALSDDISALYWNPAGLSRAGAVVGGFSAGAKARGIDVVSEGRDLVDAVRESDVKLSVFETLRDIARRRDGKAVWGTAGGVAGLGSNGVGVGGFAEGGIDALLEYSDLRPTAGYEQVTVRGASTWYHSMGVAVGREVQPGIDVGVGLRRVTAGWSLADYTTRYDGTSVTDDSDTDSFDDSSFAVDVGLMVQRDEDTTMGLMLRNLNSPSFTFRNAAMSHKMRMEPCLNLGVAHHVDNYILAADLHNLLNANGAGQTLHLGVEWRPVSMLAVRAGLHDGDFGFGLGFSLGPLNIELAADPRFKRMLALQLIGF